MHFPASTILAFLSTTAFASAEYSFRVRPGVLQSKFYEPRPATLYDREAAAADNAHYRNSRLYHSAYPTIQYARDVEGYGLPSGQGSRRRPTHKRPGGDRRPQIMPSTHQQEGKPSFPTQGSIPLVQQQQGPRTTERHDLDAREAYAHAEPGNAQMIGSAAKFLMSNLPAYATAADNTYNSIAAYEKTRHEQHENHKRNAYPKAGPTNAEMMTSAAKFLMENLPKYATAADKTYDTIAAAEKEKHADHHTKREPYPEAEAEAEAEAESN